MSLSINPAGGGDYTSYSLANAGNPGDGHWTAAAGDVGGVTITATNPTSFLLDAASNARHNGSDAGTSGIAYSTGAISTGTRAVPVVIEGLRMHAAITMTSGTTNGAVYDRTARGNLFVHDATCITAGSVIATSNQVIGRNYSVLGNVVYFGGPSSDNSVSIFVVNPHSVGTSLYTGVLSGTLLVAHNTIRQTSGQANQAARCFALTANQLNNTTTATRIVRNNVGTGAETGDFVRTTTGATISETWSHNASEDATADDYGANGALPGITVANCFVDPDADLRLKAGSPLIDAGVAIAGVNDGYLGSAPDIGFDEFVPPPSLLGSPRIRRLRRWRE